MRSRPVAALASTLAALAALASLAACTTTPRVAIEAHETFDSTSTHSRVYASAETVTCEAARRALLSQGYVIQLASREQVRAKKNFQPKADVHVEVEFHVTCVRDQEQERTIAFVNAVQDSFVIKKTSNAASVGVPAIGSLSLPFLGSDESMVRIASLTITNADFYDRFFLMLERHLGGVEPS